MECKVKESSVCLATLASKLEVEIKDSWNHKG